MEKKKTSKKAPLAAKDQKKEMYLRCLGLLLESHGIKVRREHLKRGHGWKVVSGVCSVEGERLLFVDRGMSQDEQLDFVLSRISAMGICPTSEEISQLPEGLQRQL